jgi:hypothetical protein
VQTHFFINLALLLLLTLHDRALCLAIQNLEQFTSFDATRNICFYKQARKQENQRHSPEGVKLPPQGTRHNQSTPTLEHRHHQHQ